MLLVKKGNPKAIQGIADLLREDVRLTISNLDTETASYNIYKQALLEVAAEKELDVTTFSNLIDKDSTQTIFGETIPHREVPQAIFENSADVAIVYYHLALRYSRIFPDDVEIVNIE